MWPLEGPVAVYQVGDHFRIADYSEPGAEIVRLTNKELSIEAPS
jgi:hypothetical protein